MALKNYILLGLVFLLVITPIMAKDLSLNEIQDIKDKPDLITLDAKQVEITDKLDESYIVKEEGVFFKDLKQTEPIVYIDKYELDKNKKRVYHVDSKRDFIENETVSLTFWYSTQPDTIAHYTHSGKFDRYFFPTQWLWEPNCPTEETCDGGWVTIEVGNIEEGYGSSTFPISETGSTWAYDGQFAGEFDGESSNVESNDQKFNDTFTLSVWAKPNIADETGRVIYRFDSTTKNGFYLGHTSTGDGQWGFLIFENLTSDENIIADNPPTGDWEYLVGTRNASGYMNIYINGVLQSDNGTLISNMTGSTNIKIGVDIFGGNLFNGSIDEVLIYNRTLTQAEITSLYNNYTLLSTGPQRTGTPSTDGLVLDINFDDYSVADNSGNGNHGTNTNVSFSEVLSNDQTLVSGTDYSISGATFTILDDRWDYSLINTIFDYEYYEDYGFHRSILRLIAGFVCLIVLIAAVIPIIKNKWEYNN